VRFGLLTTSLVGLLAHPMQSAAFTGNQFLEMCDSPDGQSLCTGFLIGLSAGANLGAIDAWLSFVEVYGLDQLPADYAQRGAPQAVCVSEGVTPEQLKDVVISHLLAHPEIRHEAASVLALIALQRAFPCPDAQADN